MSSALRQGFIKLLVIPLAGVVGAPQPPARVELRADLKARQAQYSSATYIPGSSSLMHSSRIWNTVWEGGNLRVCV